MWLNKITNLISIWLIWTFQVPQLCYAGNHYCANGLTTSIEMDDYYNRDETIVPLVVHEAAANRFDFKRCSWVIRAHTRKRNLLIVLQGLSAQADGNRNNGSQQLLVYSSHGAEIRVTTGYFFVYPVAQASYFTSTIEWDPRVRSSPAVKLRYLVPLPEVCSVDMLNFNGACYALSSVKQILNDAMFRIRGYAQLARFSNMSEINDFIVANRNRQLRHPYRRPLNLRQPIRLGLFGGANGTVLSIVKARTNCTLKPLLPADDLVTSGEVTGPCLSLKVNAQDEPELEFVNCSLEMITLVEFPQSDSPGVESQACSDNNLRVISDQIIDLSVRIVATKGCSTVSDQTTQEKFEDEQKILILVVVPATVALVTVLLSFIAVLILYRKRCPKITRVVTDEADALEDSQMLNYRQRIIGINSKEETLLHL